MCRETRSSPVVSQAFKRLDGSRGALRYRVERLALAVSPTWAARRSIYHGALLCGRDR